MKDIIITGAQGSGKSTFAQKYFSTEDHEIVEDVSIEEAKETSARVHRSSLPYVFITQEEIDLRGGNRRFIIIKMPDNGN